MTYREAFNCWLDEHSITISRSTAYAYRKDSKNAILYFGETNVLEIQRVDIIAFVKLEISKGYASSTIRSHFKGIKSTFEWLYDSRIIIVNPYFKIPLPKKVYREINPFTVEEMKKILSVDMPEWVHDAIEIAYRTGMRKGEIFALKWSDIDFKNGFIQVKRTQSIYAGKMELREPKSKASRRRITIDKHLIKLLETKEEVSESKYVFSVSDGTPKIPWELSCKRFKTVCKRAGVEPRRFHDLRHTHATVLLSAGVHPKIVQERLGHSSIKTTLDTYSHLIPTMQQSAVDVFNDQTL